MKQIAVIFILFFVHFSGFTQQVLKGVVQGKEQHGEHDHSEPLLGVNVYWLGTQQGTTTDKDGRFILKKTDNQNSLKLVISYIGYRNDTIVIAPGQKEVSVLLEESKELNEVTVRENLEGNYISKLKPHKTEVISSEGLCHMACCNLSESFQNTATVDVGYTDAVTGAKQIQMLGLAGVYSQLLTENLPLLRGLSSSFGLSSIPGVWMESIQISKGASSVVNGYESISGQINVEFKKPEKSDPLFLSIFTNQEGRTELNAGVAARIDSNWTSLLLAHASAGFLKTDHNNDGFMDVPLSRQLNVSNRWSYEKKEKINSKIGVSYLHEERESGQLFFNKPNDYLTQNYYGIGIISDNFQFYAKSGFQLAKPETNIAFQSSFTYHEQKSFYGQKRYNGSQASGFFNAMYETILNSKNHKLNSGVSIMLDDFKERFHPDIISDTLMVHREIVPGIFSQYTYSLPDKISMIAGLRADYNSVYGVLVTPRFHFKWDAGRELIIRGSAGRGYRTARIFAENMAMLASSREIVFSEKLNIEEAWNYGANINKEFDLDDKRKITAGIDFYRTDFVNQVIADIEQVPGKILFYNLTGRSYSNSLQADFSINPIKRMDVNVAFRVNDVKTTINNKLVDKPFVSRYKGIVSLAYTTDKDLWKFNFTAQFNGKSRLPDVQVNSMVFLRNEMSPEFFMLHAQITRKFKYTEVYAGVENMLDFRQQNAIIAANEPFGNYFDASRIWGPLDGRVFYVGVRFALTKKEEVHTEDGCTDPSHDHEHEH